MKKLLALVMALAMLLTLPALAENVAEAPAPDIAEPQRRTSPSPRRRVLWL